MFSPSANTLPIAWKLCKKCTAVSAGINRQYLCKNSVKHYLSNTQSNQMDGRTDCLYNLNVQYLSQGSFFNLQRFVDNCVNLGLWQVPFFSLSGICVYVHFLD